MIKYFVSAWVLTALATVLVDAQLIHRSAGVAGSLSSALQTEKVFNQEQAIAELRKKIAEQKDKPAEEVFKNIQLLKGVPAGRLLSIMQIGYSKSLGVDCTHCHLVDQWEKDDKPTKQITRDMALMVRNINNEQLKKIKNLKSENPGINCTTCHRGQTKPALNIE